LVVLKRLLAMRVALGKVCVAAGMPVCLFPCPCAGAQCCSLMSQGDASHGMSSHPVVPRLPLSCGAPG
jgi:hypothetical protein